MSSGGCYDKIRFTLSDSSGVLRFTSFDFVDAPECAETARALGEYLVGRPLAEVDVEYLCAFRCAGSDSCMRALTEVIREHRGMFLSVAPAPKGKE
jgi:hypothetical protein